jgi:hypothetical protein
VILVFASISLALSSLIDNQVVTTVLACGLIFFMFLFGPISGMMFGMNPQSYENNYLYMIDGSYHLGNSFAPALEQALGGEMLPPQELGELKYFAGIFKGGRMGDSYESSEYQYPGELANYVTPPVSATLLMVLVAGSLAVSVLMTERKDVG